MARFTFRLQPVLEHKRRLEEVTQVELVRRQGAQRGEEGALERLAAAEAETVLDLERQRRTGRLPIELLQLSLSIQDALTAQIQHQAAAVEQAALQTAAARAELLGCVQERKALEQLREHQHEAFALEAQRVEGRELDDLVAGRAARAIFAARREPVRREPVHRDSVHQDSVHREPHSGPVEWEALRRAS